MTLGSTSFCRVDVSACRCSCFCPRKRRFCVWNLLSRSGYALHFRTSGLISERRLSVLPPHSGTLSLPGKIWSHGSRTNA